MVDQLIGWIQQFNERSLNTSETVTTTTDQFQMRTLYQIEQKQHKKKKLKFWAFSIVTYSDTCMKYVNYVWVFREKTEDTSFFDAIASTGVFHLHSCLVRISANISFIKIETNEIQSEQLWKGRCTTIHLLDQMCVYFYYHIKFTEYARRNKHNNNNNKNGRRRKKEAEWDEKKKNIPTQYSLQIDTSICSGCLKQSFTLLYI